jgi:hypothetical protein
MIWVQSLTNLSLEINSWKLIGLFSNKNFDHSTDYREINQNWQIKAI